MLTIDRRRICLSLAMLPALSLPAGAGYSVERDAYLIGPPPKDADKAIAVLTTRLEAAGRHPVITRTQQGLRVEVDAEPRNSVVPLLLSRQGRFAIHAGVERKRDCPPSLPPATICQPGRKAGDGVYVMREKPDIAGDVLAAVSSGTDPHSGMPVLSFRFRPDAARAFGELTTRSLGQLLAMVVDGEIVMVPRINEPILGGTGYVSGETPEEVEFWSALFAAPPLDAPFEVLSVESAQPVTRGRRTRK